MKKNLFLLAIAGASIMVASTQAHAQLPAQTFNPNSFAVGQPDAQSFSVSGEIPEFLQITSVDNQLEFGNMGGPLHTGLPSSTPDSGYVASQRDIPNRPYNSSTTAYVYNTSNDPVNDTAGNLISTPNGFAGVQFRANAYVVIQARADRLRNAGPDGTSNTADDVVLATGYVSRYRGVAKSFTSPVVTDGTTVSTSGMSASLNTVNSPTLGYNSYSPWTNIAGDDALVNQIVFKPGSVPDHQAPYNTNGFLIKARVARHGLNDYRGDYAAQIRMTYYKF